MTARSTRGLLIGLGLGCVLGATAVALIPKRLLPTWASGVRARMWRIQEESDRAFVDVPEGSVHLRMVPSRDLRMPGNHHLPGTLDSYEDAVHEFFRDDTRTWSVHLVEMAVPESGILTVDVVDRPGKEDPPTRIVARLRTRVEAGVPLLVGFGLEGLGQTAVGLGDLVQPPGAPPIKPSRLEWPPVREHRLRLLIGGGVPFEGSGTVLSRAYTTTLTRSAWGSTCTVEHAFTGDAIAPMRGMRPRWIDGPPLTAGGHLSGSAGAPGVLGMMLWAPLNGGGAQGSHSSWVNGRVHDEHAMGTVTATRTNTGVTLRVSGKPTELRDYPYPAWVVRARFDSTMP